MDENRALQILEEQVKIPAVVEKKAASALALIQAQARAGQEQGSRQEGSPDKDSLQKAGQKDYKAPRSTKKTALSGRRHRWMAIGLAAALAACGISAVAATYFRWTRGIEAELNVTEKEKAAAEKSGLASNPAAEETLASATANGVTITAEQTLVDDYYAMIAFKVSGFDIPDQEEPAFGSLDYEVEGTETSMSGGFFDGLIPGPEGYAVQTNGDPYETNEDGSIKTYYKQDDGSYEFHMAISSIGKKGVLFGKQIHVTFENLGYYAEKVTPLTTMEGTWDLTWTLSGVSSAREVTSGEALGETGATLVSAVISPISLIADISFPVERYEETAYDQDGEESMASFYRDPPYLVGVRLRDGTMLPYILDGPGSMGFLDNPAEGELGIYEVRMMVDRILDPAEVDALLFIKDTGESDEPVEQLLTDDDFYVVPVR